MKQTIQWAVNPHKDSAVGVETGTILNGSIEQEVMEFHKSFEAYNETPLCSLSNLAEQLEVGNLYVKDESYRFGLNAFKVLGASYAIGKTLAKKLGKDLCELPVSELKTKEVRDQLGELKFIATTDGNHGRGVAWTAKQLGFEAEIYMPAGTTQNRLNHILGLGAKGEIKPYNYDDTVRWMIEYCKSEDNIQIVQDTAWEGYEDVPTYIMQGYSTVAKEITEQLQGVVPTHIFLQAGVGAFAAMMTIAFLNQCKDNPPKIIIVEADQADCFYRSIKGGKATAVTGELNTIMAGLACGEMNPLAWEILRQHADVFLSVEDGVAARGMRVLGNPLKGDQAIISGESGAAGFGVVSLLADEAYQELREVLAIDQTSNIVTVSTEGDTDAEMYRKIVWGE